MAVIARRLVALEADMHALTDEFFTLYSDYLKSVRRCEDAGELT